MNTIGKDNIPTLDTRQGRASERSETGTGNAGGSPSPVAGESTPDDSLTLSGTGMLLNRSASQTAAPGSRPQSLEQAEALVARIKQQFTLDGSLALKSHTPGKGHELEGVLNSAPA